MDFWRLPAYLPTNSMKAIAMAERISLRSSKGTKLYAVRDKKGRFKDIQTFKTGSWDSRTKTVRVTKALKSANSVTGTFKSK